MASISASGREWVWARIRSEHPATGDQVITTYTVEVAFTLADPPVSGDWKPAAWDGTDTVGGKPYSLARILVGPGGTIALAVGEWQVWARIGAAPEQPVIHCGSLTITP